MIARFAAAAAWAAALHLMAAGAAEADAAYVWNLPPGFPIPVVPADNPMSTAKAQLGRLLFFDTRLSVTGRYSCASCHDPSKAFTDGRALAIGATGERLTRSSPSLIDVAYRPRLTSAARPVRSLEAQLCKPLFNDQPIEIGLKGREPALLAQLASDRATASAFEAAFPQDAAPVGLANLVKAIAAYERTLIGGRSAFDRYVYDDDAGAMTPSARRGMALFYSSRAGCANCHFGLDFSGEIQYQGHQPAATRAGRATPPTPTLRNIALTAPYLHDGRAATLEAVIDDYDQAGKILGRRDPRLRPLNLSPPEKADLVAFLGSLTDHQ